MARRPATFELMLPPRPAGWPAFRWLSEGLRGEILAGRAKPGAFLPSSRELARQYGLARGTVVGVYEQLAVEGYLEGTVGAGTRVACTLPDQLLSVAPTPRADRLRPAPGAQPASAATPRLSSYAKGLRLSPGPPSVRPLVAFRPNLPAVDLFPTRLWAQVASRRLKRLGAADLHSCHPQGDAELRSALAEYLAVSRGVRATPDQVVIVSGVQEALDITIRMVINPGDTVVVENPGYAEAPNLFAAVGAKVRRVPVDGEGITLGATSPPARLAYITPAHQYPLGVTMSISRRLSLLEWAEARGALIFEDDYDSEFRYSGRPVPALQGLGSGQAVIFAGSFSKVLFPALRLGYLVVPPAMVERFRVQRELGTRHPPVLEQKILLDFITQGHFGRHLRRMRQIYAERAEALLESARAELGGGLDFNPVEAGLQTTARLLLPIAATAVAGEAAKRGLEVVPLSHFSPTPLPFEGLQLGFAAIPEAEIRRGMEELARVIEVVSTRPLAR